MRQHAIFLYLQRGPSARGLPVTQVAESEWRFQEFRAFYLETLDQHIGVRIPGGQPNLSFISRRRQ